MKRRKPKFKRWKTSKAIRVGILTGMGRTAPAIARELGDGTSANAIRTHWRRAKLVDRKRVTLVQVPLSSARAGRLGLLAEARGIEPGEWAARVLSAAIYDDLFEALAGDKMRRLEGIAK